MPTHTHHPDLFIPLAYFITFSCYGSWLHGSRKSSVDSTHNILNTPFLTTNTLRELCEKNRMRELPYYLDEKKDLSY